MEIKGEKNGRQYMCMVRLENSLVMVSVNKLRRVEGGKELDEEASELFKKSDLTDITLVVEEKELHFAKYLLMEGSSVFAKMIKSSADPSRLIIDNVTYRDMIMFLKCLHPKGVLSITDNNLEPVATIAHTFQYERILGICEQYIIQQIYQLTTTDDTMYPNFFFHLKVADKCGLKKAIEVGVSSKPVAKVYFSGDFWRGAYENNANFLQLSWETKYNILSRRLKETEKWTPPVKK